jgi:U-box domain
MMVHPLVNRAGHSFEAIAILDWLSKTDKCPLTRKPMLPSDFIRNRRLEHRIREFRIENNLRKGPVDASNDYENHDWCTKTMMAEENFVFLEKESLSSTEGPSSQQEENDAVDVDARLLPEEQQVLMSIVERIPAAQRNGRSSSKPWLLRGLRSRRRRRRQDNPTGTALVA